MTAASGSAVPTVALFLPSLDGGGAERVFVELANEFAASGLRVDFVLASARGPYLGEVSSRVRIVDFKVARVLSALPKLVRYLRSERPVAILSALDHANVIAVIASRMARTGTRCIISMRAVPTEIYPKDGSGGSRVLLRMMKIAYRFADAIIANSGAVALDLSKLLGIPIDAIHVLHNPLNLQRIADQSREPVDHPWQAEGGPPIILGVGSFVPRKDFATLVRAFAIVRARRECRLVILGDGPERDKLASLARQSGVADDLCLPGFVPNPYPWIRRASVFVSSSTTEGCPNALMQAMALGTPIVATNCVGGSAELLENGRWGRLVPVGAPGAMAEAIGAILDAPHHPNVRERAADFSHERIARKFLEVLLPGDETT